MKTKIQCGMSRAFVVDFENFLIHAFMESTTYHPGINITLVPKVLAKLKTKCTIALPWYILESKYFRDCLLNLLKISPNVNSLILGKRRVSTKGGKRDEKGKGREPRRPPRHAQSQWY